MSQLRVDKLVGMGIRFGTLAVALALVAGVASGQEDPPAPQVKDPPIKEEPKVPANLPPPQPPVPVLHPAPDPVAGAKAAAVAKPHQINVMEEIVTGIIILFFTAGGVVAVAMTARFIYRLTAPSDLVTFALSDPWVRANLGRLEAGTVDQPPSESPE
jgi:hypothetical protein